MIGTNRDLALRREAVDDELLRLTTLKGPALDAVSAENVTFRIGKLQRERIALCAAIVNRRREAARPIVSFTRWASGGGALNALFSPGVASFALEQP